MKTLKILYIILILFAFISCSQISNEHQENSKGGNEYSRMEHIYTLSDLILLSKEKYGFLSGEGTINESYGDIECTSIEKGQFHFNIGCGSAGDIILIVVEENKKKINYFDIYIPKGELFFGNQTLSNIKIGELEIISENEIRGNINYCVEESSGCCGEVGEHFVLERIRPTTVSLER